MTVTEHVRTQEPLPPATTTVPHADPDAPADRPRTIGTRSHDDWWSLIGAAVSSLCLVWVLYEQVLLFSGKIGFFLGWWLLFVCLYAGVAALSQPRPVVVDRVATAAVHGAAAIVVLGLGSTLLFVFVKGWPAYTHVNFFTSDMSGVAPTAGFDHGGILHAVVGSLIEIGIAVVIALPLGIAAAVYMTEVGGKLSRWVRTVIEAMTALPDLVAGLFIYAVLIVGLGQNRNGLAAALAISITMLPIIARSSEVVLRNVPSGLREASAALGAPDWQTVLRVVLPTARSGLSTALILGIARGIGETAPVLITSGTSTFLEYDPTGNPMNSLPLFVYASVRSGQPANITRGYGAASVLLAFVLILFVIVRLLGRQPRGR
jgi:phosphate transport system permease protein